MLSNNVAKKSMKCMFNLDIIAIDNIDNIDNNLAHEILFEKSINRLQKIVI